MLGVCVYSTFTYLREDNTGLPGSLCLSRDTRRPYSVIWKSLSPFQDVGIVEKYWATIHPELADQYSMSTELRFTPTIKVSLVRYRSYFAGESYRIKGLIITLLQVGGQWWRSPGCEHTTRCVLEAFCLTLNPEFGSAPISSLNLFFLFTHGQGLVFRVFLLFTGTLITAATSGHVLNFQKESWYASLLWEFCPKLLVWSHTSLGVPASEIGFSPGRMGQIQLYEIMPLSTYPFHCDKMFLRLNAPRTTNLERSKITRPFLRGYVQFPVSCTFCPTLMSPRASRTYSI